MVEIFLDGECRNGQRAERLASDHWRLEARADTDHYGYYFNFQLRAGAAGEVVVDVAPDSDRPGGLASFRRHRPDAVWVSRGPGWQRHPTSPDAPADCVRVRLTLEAGLPVSVSRTRPVGLSAVTERLADLAAHLPARSVSPGQSAEGRPIPGLEVGEGSRRIL